jgi:tetratricopeptide (TPR) repeat protein
MFRILRQLFKQVPLWDRPSQIGFTMGVVLLVALLVITALAPPESRTAPLITFMIVLLVLQVLVLWANRGLVTPYTRAQRHYLNGDFEAARDILEQSGDQDVRALTLLGNTYRQLGNLDKSQEILKDLSTKHYNNYFPLYGFGRTLLVMGQYAEAAETIQRALENGAPPAVQADLGEALYRQGWEEAALKALQTVRPIIHNEPYRALMVDYLLYRLGAGTPPDITLIQSGLAYWVASAERFRHTPYGLALQMDIEDLQNFGG